MTPMLGLVSIETVTQMKAVIWSDKTMHHDNVNLLGRNDFWIVGQCYSLIFSDGMLEFFP